MVKSKAGSTTTYKALPPRVLRDIRTPTAKHIEERSVIPVPFKAWCRFLFVKGKMPNPAHRRLGECQRGVPERGLGYAFMKESRCEEDSLNIIVKKGRDTHISWHVAELKGRCLAGTAERVVDSITKAWAPQAHCQERRGTSSPGSGEWDHRVAQRGNGP